MKNLLGLKYYHFVSSKQQSTGHGLHCKLGLKISVSTGEQEECSNTLSNASFTVPECIKIRDKYMYKKYPKDT
jgi:hypothetical protein